jgi:hypothetical protein
MDNGADEINVKDGIEIDDMEDHGDGHKTKTVDARHHKERMTANRDYKRYEKFMNSNPRNVKPFKKRLKKHPLIKFIPMMPARGFHVKLNAYVSAPKWPPPSSSRRVGSSFMKIFLNVELL